MNLKAEQYKILNLDSFKIKKLRLLLNDLKLIYLIYI